MMVDHFVPLLGPGLFYGYSSKWNSELKAIKSGLASTRTSAPLEHHRYLEKRAEIFRTIIETPEFNEWKEKQITQKTVAMFELLSPMVPGENQQIGIHDLERLVRECYGIGQQLAVYPCDWEFERAIHGESWNAKAMVFGTRRLLVRTNGWRVVLLSA